MNSYLLRFKIIIEKKKLSVTSFANTLGLKQSSINNLFLRNTVPKVELCYKICKVHGVNLNWLVTGQGEIFLSDNSHPLSQEQRKYGDKKSNSLTESPSPSLQSSTINNPVIEACADSARLLIRSMNETKATRSLQLINQVLIDEDKSTDKKEQSNYTAQERKAS